MNLQIDDQLIKIDNLKWLPWIGNNYDKFNFLIVGESHYLSNTLESKESASEIDYTRRNIEEIGIDGFTWGTTTYPNFHKTIFGHEDFDSNTFWNSVAYHNIVQRPMDSSNGRPTSTDFIEGWKILLLTISALKSNTCLFIGNTASNYLMSALEGTDFTISGHVERIKKINGAYAKRVFIHDSKNNEVKLVFIKHTSHHYNWESWNEFLNEELPTKISQLRQHSLRTSH